MRLKKKHFYAAVIVLVIVAAFVFYFNSLKKAQNDAGETPQEKDEIAWLVDKEGHLYYPLGRGGIPFNRKNISETENLTVSKIIFPSRRGNVYGLLVLPKRVSDRLPGVVLLPGAGVSKESELALAKKIAELGAAVFTIDQRGVGETGGNFPDLDNDFNDFSNAKEPYQHLMVYDALRAYDLLYSAPFVDPDRIMIAGESLGGRIAVIAAALDRNIKGVLVISSAGLNFEPKGDVKKDAFLQSIDSDHYISLITPRKLVMMHNFHDKNIPLSSAINSYSKAEEPKRFVLVNDTTCNHGYCDSMYNGLVDALDYIVDIKSRTIVSVPVG